MHYGLQFTGPDESDLVESLASLQADLETGIYNAETGTILRALLIYLCAVCGNLFLNDVFHAGFFLQARYSGRE